MGKSLGGRHWRRRSHEIEASPQAVYLKVLGELGALSFDPELRTAAQLAGISPVDSRRGPAGPVAQGGSRNGASPEPTALTSHHVRPLESSGTD